MDERERLISRGYELFSEFSMPSSIIAPDEIMDEFVDWDRKLSGTPREKLNVKEIGGHFYSAIMGFSEHALVYYMPRLIEFSLNGDLDKNEEPFIVTFASYFVVSPPESKCFRLLRKPHKDYLCRVFEFIYKDPFCRELFYLQADLEDLEKVAMKWNDK